jgi:hypothetical protein
VKIREALDEAQADLNDLAFKLVRSDRNVGTDCSLRSQLRKATIPSTDLVTIRFLVHKQRRALALSRCVSLIVGIALSIAWILRLCLHRAKSANVEET